MRTIIDIPDDLLREIDTLAKRELESFEELYSSLITWMEILVGATEGDEKSEIRAFPG